MTKLGLGLVLALMNTLSHAEGVRIQNHLPVFRTFWAQAASLGPTEQIEQFKRTVVSDFPAYYRFKFQKWEAQGKKPDEELKTTLQEFPKIRDAFESHARAIEASLQKDVALFKKQLPDFETNIDIHLLHSLGEMDGGGRRIDGKMVFIFGLDNIAKYHDWENQTPFFHHEFFHFYHGQFYKPESRIDSALWMEGLATYASQILNPKATQREMVLDAPSGMVKAVRAKLKFLAGDLRRKLHSSREEDYATYFLMTSQNPEIPLRSGYYLGYLIAQELGKTRTLAELAKLDGEGLYEEIANALKKIEESAPKP